MVAKERSETNRISQSEEEGAGLRKAFTSSGFLLVATRQAVQFENLHGKVTCADYGYIQGRGVSSKINN